MTAPLSEPAALYLLQLLIEAESWSVRDIRAWADRHIETTPSSPAWILELSIADAGDTARAVIDHALWRSGGQESEWLADGPWGADRRSALLIGFCLLRFERGSATRAETNREILGILDAYQPGFLAVDDPRLVAAGGDALRIVDLAPMLDEMATACRSLERRLVRTVFDESLISSGE